MRAAGDQSLRLLLRTHAAKPERSFPDSEDRRDLHRSSVLRITQNHKRAEKKRYSGKSQNGRTADADNGHCGHLPDQIHKPRQ